LWVRPSSAARLSPLQKMTRRGSTIVIGERETSLNLSGKSYPGRYFPLTNLRPETVPASPKTSKGRVGGDTTKASVRGNSSPGPGAFNEPLVVFNPASDRAVFSLLPDR